MIIAIPVIAKDKIMVVTTTEDLASIAKSVGGEKIEVVSLSKGWQDPHLVEPRPSMVMQLRKADLLVKIGMDLDMWIDGLIDAARNKNIVYGEKGYVDVSVGISVLEKPEGKIDASMGDIHLYGNPHYWLNPENGKVIGKNILEGLIRNYPEFKEEFGNNYKKFCAGLDNKIEVWRKRLLPWKNTPVVIYHQSWPYFSDFAGLKIAATIEPKPGIPPRPAYIRELIQFMKKEKPVMILQENFYSEKTGKMISSETGTPFLILPPSTGGVKEVKDYAGLFDYIVGEIEKKAAR